MAIYRDRNWRSDFLEIFSIIGVLAPAIFCSENHALAQITPDGTLGDNSSKLTPNVNIKGLPADRIDGGATRGANLFHSFQEFNVGESQPVYFANPTGIENILTRVTGSNISKILGTLGVDGGANLFFINPNGILFGNNARLDVAGSFVGSTANSFVFGNGLEFSATNPQTPSGLLTVNPSALFFNQLQAGRIENRSIAPAGIDPAGFNAFGLRVPDGKSLLLVGGNLSMDGGNLQVPGGRVELGGLAGAGTVGLSIDGNNLGLNFPDNVARADVSLLNGAKVDVTSTGGGSVAINARNIELGNPIRRFNFNGTDIFFGDSTRRTSLNAGILSGQGSPGSQAGDITLNATEGITINNANINNKVNSNGSGNAGDINITARSLSMTSTSGFSFLNTDTQGSGNAGSITIQASDQVSLINSIITSQVSIRGIFNFKITPAEGNAGNITIKTPSLSIDRGGLRTSTFGRGNAGTINLQANDISFNADTRIESTVGATVGIAGAEGKGGDINITTGSLSLTNRSQLTTGVFGRGDGGNINIHASDAVYFDRSDAFSEVSRRSVGNGGNINIAARSVSLSNGAQLFTATFGQGNAGNVHIQARDTVVLDGVGATSGGFTLNASRPGPSLIWAADGANNLFRSGIFTSVEPSTDQFSTQEEVSTTQGNGGNINITARAISVTNGARLVASTSARGNAGTIKVNAAANVTVSGSSSNVNSGLFVDSQSTTGTAGDIIVTSPKITLDNQGKLNAESASGNGGNINLNSDFLLLRRNSQISTNAGTEKLGGNGGNININSRFIVAVPKENSDISANAFTGKGGRVDITANGIFGIVPQERPTQNSDITASSELGVSGEVTINTPDTDPARGLVQLPSNLVDASQQIASGCTPGGRQTASSFIATGRGGLPLSPNEPLRGRAVITGWVDLPPQATQRVTDKLSVEVTDKKTTTSITKPTSQIVEAQGWIVDANGDVILVAQSGQSSSIPSAMSCSQ